MAFDITLLGGSSFQLDVTLAPSGKGVFPCQWQLDLQFCVFSLSGRGLHLVRAHCGVCGCCVCPSLLPQLPTRPILLRLSSEAPPQLETSLGPWVFWDSRGCGGGRRGLQASQFGSDSGSALLAVVRASVSFFLKRGQQRQLHQCVVLEAWQKPVLTVSGCPACLRYRFWPFLFLLAFFSLS